MTFSGHFAIALLSLQLSHDPWLIIPANILLHLAADAVPHAEWQRPGESTAVGRALMFADSVVTGALAALLVVAAQPAWIGIAAGIASVFPDLTDQLARRYARGFRYFHDATHTWPLKPSNSLDWRHTVTGTAPRWLKFGIQIALVGAALAAAH